MNTEILRILNDKNYDYAFKDKIRTTIFNKIETHKFTSNNEFVYICIKCNAEIIFEYDVAYNHDDINEILTCEEQIIKNIIE